MAEPATSPRPDLTGGKRLGAQRPALRFLTCGSVDDGKSTLIGRLLHEQDLIPEDHAAALARASRRFGTTAGVDFALLVDGLAAEREQGITIDVAYRYFETAKRSFVAIDTPGHEQYTRNMATGASNADLAVLLVDARKGLTKQTHRHAAIVSLLGIGHIVLAVNKMDLVGYSRTVFAAIEAEFRQKAGMLRVKVVTAIPLSALNGDNLSDPSPHTPWYRGSTLLRHLETIDVSESRADRPFRMPVQWINRPSSDFRGVVGTVASGQVRVGDELVVAHSGRVSTVSRIVTADGDRDCARAGDAITLVLADEIDVARGDVLAPPRARPQVGTDFAAHLIWMGEQPLQVGSSYFLKLATRTVPARIGGLESRLDVESGRQEAVATLRLNEIGIVQVATATPLAFDPYAEDPTTGAFILIDRATNETAAAGLITAGLRRATNIHRQEGRVSRADRVRLKDQQPGTLWFTGLPAAGKSTIANLVEARLNRAGAHTILLDGDALRHGLNKDLGFSQADRLENIRRVGEVARLMTDAGLIVLCSFVSPFREERLLAREIAGAAEFMEIFVDTPIETCIARDPKGLYKRAMAGEIKNFTGINQAYEAPDRPDLIVGGAESAAEAAARVLGLLAQRGLFHHLEEDGS